MLRCVLFCTSEITPPIGVDFGNALLANGADGMVDPSDFELSKVS